MIKLKVHKGMVSADVGGDDKLVQAEIIMAFVFLTMMAAKSEKISFETAALKIMQQAVLANKQAEDDINKLRGDAK